MEKIDQPQQVSPSKVAANYANFLPAFFLAIFGLVSVILFAKLSASPYADSIFIQANKLNQGWLTLNNKNTNAYYLWRTNPFLGRAVVFFQLGYLGLIAIYSAIFSSGAFCCFWRLSSNRAAAFYSALALQLAILILFGFDTTIFSSLAWWPWLLYLILLSQQDFYNQKKLFFYSALIVVSGLFAYDAGQLALPLLLVNLILNKLLNRSNKLSTLSIIFLLLPALLSSLRYPALAFPSYPLGSHLVPNYTTSIGIYPLIGPEAPLPVIDRSFLHFFFYKPALLLLGGSILLFFIFSKQFKSSSVRAFLSLAIILSLCLVLDTQFVDANFRQIAPLASLSRLLPGVSLVPLAPIILTLIIFLLFAVLSFFARLAGVLAGVTVLIFFGVSLIGANPLPFLQRHTKTDLYQALSNNPSLAISAEHKKLLNSPSYYLFYEYGPALFELQNLSKDLKYRFLKHYNATLSASHNQNELINLKDRKPRTRWSTLNGAQTGNEWIHLELENLEKIRAVQLDIEMFKTDFPRGLEVAVAQSCNLQDFKDYRTVFSSLDWQGAVRFTEEGYPYYTAQSEVELVLPEVVEAKCILIKQIGRSKAFDWSIQEIKIAVVERIAQ